MSRAAAEQPKHLAIKLREIRLRMGLTQDAMAEALKLQGVKIHTGYISLYESKRMTPSLLVVLAYAQIAGVSSDILINDKMELPPKLKPQISSKS